MSATSDAAKELLNIAQVNGNYLTEEEVGCITDCATLLIRQEAALLMVQSQGEFIGKLLVNKG